MDNKNRNIVSYMVVVFIVLICSIAAPIIINSLYMSEYKIWYTVWEGNDVLSYFGIVLSALGTLFLGLVAISQTHKYNDMVAEANDISTKASDIADKSLTASILANEISDKVFKLQLEEHQPVLRVEKFVGKRFEQDNIDEKYSNDYISLIDTVYGNDPRKFYNIVIDKRDKGSNKNNYYCNVYKVTFRYYGKTLLEKFKINYIEINGKNEIIHENIDKYIDVSMKENDEISLFLTLYDLKINKIDKESIGNFKLNIELKTISNKIFMENVIISNYVCDRDVSIDNVRMILGNEYLLSSFIERQGEIKNGKDENGVN